jgi:hypothetical protein
MMVPTFFMSYLKTSLQSSRFTEVTKMLIVIYFLQMIAELDNETSKAKRQLITYLLPIVCIVMISLSVSFTSNLILESGFDLERW